MQPPKQPRRAAQAVEVVQAGHSSSSQARSAAPASRRVRDRGSPPPRGAPATQSMGPSGRGSRSRCTLLREGGVT
eukprot:2737494-Alexandrium_andersonii.AAC.1